MHIIIDTNVLIVANKKAHQASPQCVINCIQRLQKIQENNIVVIDQNWKILNEYKHKVSSSGQPGVGDAFLRWVLTNLNNPTRCEQVQITQISENTFVEFPTDAELEKFDPSDRKFVAVANVHPAHPRIVNAVDSDWREFELALARHSILIEFLCPDVV